MDDNLDGLRDITIAELTSTLEPAEQKLVKEAISKALMDSVSQPDAQMEQGIATIAKNEIEWSLGGSWNVVVGNRYGLSVNICDNKYVQLLVDEKYNVFVFKSVSLKANAAAKI